MGKICSFCSLKGGVGKTTLVCSLASLCATVFKKRVLVIDANYSQPHIALHLGVMSLPKTLHDVLERSVPAQEAIFSTEHGFHLIGGLLSGKAQRHTSLKPFIHSLAELYDLILIDTSNAYHEFMPAAKASDELYGVVTPDHICLSSTLKLDNFLKNRGLMLTGLLLNKVTTAPHELSLEKIEHASELSLLGSIEYDTGFLTALSTYSPAPELVQSSTRAALHDAGAKLCGVPHKHQEQSKNILQFFKKK